MFNPKTFYSILLPMYKLTLIVGLTQFKITKKYCTTSKFKLIWCILYMSWLNIYSHSVTHNNQPINNSLIASTTNFLDAAFSMFGLFFEILFGCIFAKDVVNLLQGLDRFDQTAKTIFNVDLLAEYKRSQKQLTIALGLTLLCLMVFIGLIMQQSTYLLTLERFGEFIKFVFPSIINTCVIFQFCTLVVLIRQRYSWLNKKIRVLSHKIEKKSLRSTFGKVFTMKINIRPSTLVVATGAFQDKIMLFLEKIRIKHYELCDYGKLLNKAYSFQILFVLLQDFMTVIASLYYCGKYIVIDRIPLHYLIDYLIYSAIAFLLAVLRILTLVICTAATLSEAHKTGVLIHKLMNANVTVKNSFKQELHSEILFISLQLLQQRLEFTVCRIFTIDVPLIFSVVGAITTYLVIIVQFELQQLHA